MNYAPRSLAFLSCVFCLSAPTPAGAGLFNRGDDCAPCTRNARAETEAERCNAKRFASLDCEELKAYAESSRMAVNQRLLSSYYRPVFESAPAPGPIPRPRTLPAPVPYESPVFSRPLPGSGAARPGNP